MLKNSTVSPPRGIQDIEDCVELLGRTMVSPLGKMDKEFGISSLRKAQRDFFRVVKIDSKIVAWLTAKVVQSQYYPEFVLTQWCCCCEVKGIIGYRCIIMLHDEMEKEARKLKLAGVVSTCNEHDTTFLFARILEKHGWNRIGYMAYKSLSN